MQIIDCIQGSDEWHLLRSKRMTASHATAIGASGEASLKGKKLPAGLKTYITELMQDIYSSKEKEHFANKDTDRGNALEDSAAFVYTIETGFEVEKIGFVKHSEHVGCSPDGYTGEGGLIEIKAPNDKEYFRLLVGGAISSGYIWQMQCQMLICEKPFCDHVMFNPNFGKKLIIKRVMPDPEKFAALEKGFEIGEKMIKEIEEKMAQILQ